MTSDQIEEMRRDMEAGTPGPFLIDRPVDGEAFVVAPWADNVRPETCPLFGYSEGGIICKISFHTHPDGLVRKDVADANARRIARVPQLEAEVLRLRDALRTLEIQASETSRRGAVTGNHWTHLTSAILKARSILKGHSQ